MFVELLKILFTNLDTHTHTHKSLNSKKYILQTNSVFRTKYKV